MKSQATGADDTRQIAPIYGVWNGEMLINAPIRNVWRYMLDYSAWQNFPIVRHISGPVGQEGEVVMLKKGEEGFEFPPYFARTIKLDPPHRVVWKTYLEKGSQEIDIFGIVDFRAEKAQGKTRFLYNSTYEFLVPYRQKSELETFRKLQDENFRRLFSTVFPRLKQIAEQSA
jgi:uncharacterized protein YndB with AHSA1/START domain